MIHCSVCGSNVTSRAYKKHVTSIKHATYQKLSDAYSFRQLNTVNPCNDVGNLYDFEDMHCEEEVYDKVVNDSNVPTVLVQPAETSINTITSLLTSNNLALHNDSSQHHTIQSPLSDGYDECSDNNDVNTESSLFSKLDRTSNSKNTSYSVSSSLNATEEGLLKLKTSCLLSSTTMNKIISFCHSAVLSDLPTYYENLEAKLLHQHDIISATTDDNIKWSFIPLQNWLPVLLQINLLLSLVISPSSSAQLIGDVTTGTWFKEFIKRTPGSRLPVAVDIYYDHWQVSDSCKIGGLYMTVANVSPHFLMQPDNKFVLALVPEGVNLQSVLFSVLYDFISHEGLFEVELDGTLYEFYIEVSRLIGDIPGLAELCCVLNHRANSPCRKCKVVHTQLLQFDRMPLKSQSEILHILSTNMPLLEVHGNIGTARATIREYGLKAVLPVWLRLPPAMQFDLTAQSVTCMLHNEELGIMQNEIVLFTQKLSSEQLEQLIISMMTMPVIPGLPPFKRIFIEKPQVLLGKEVITMTKFILSAAYPIVQLDSSLLPYWKSLHSHIVYFRALAQPTLPLNLVPELQNLIIAHHTQFVQLYLTTVEGTPVDNRFVNPHMGMHWQEHMEQFGMPIYYSTMHWEPKHKQLKQIKERQTNNTNHSRDVLQYELLSQILRCTSWLHHKTISATTSYKLAFPTTTIKIIHATVTEQKTFFSHTLTDTDIKQTNRLLMQIQRDWQDYVQLVRSVVMHDFTYKTNDNIVIWGDKSFWFAKILYIFAYEVNRQIRRVCAKVMWYQPIKYEFGDIVTNSTQHLQIDNIQQNSMQQFDYITACLLQETDVIDLAAAYRPIMVLPLHTIVVNNPNYIFLLDCCYFVNKMFELNDE